METIDTKVLSEPIVEKHFNVLFALNHIAPEDTQAKINFLANRTGYEHSSAETSEQQLRAYKMAYLRDMRSDSPFD